MTTYDPFTLSRQDVKRFMGNKGYMVFNPVNITHTIWDLLAEKDGFRYYVKIKIDGNIASSREKRQLGIFSGKSNGKGLICEYNPLGEVPFNFYRTDRKPFEI
jgi:hypothetical protein